MSKEITHQPMPVLIQDLGMHFANESSKKKYRYGIYKCSCGNEFKSLCKLINIKEKISCGCLNKNRTHNMTKHRLYATWKDILRRTTVVYSNSYKYYGARGITVCERWLDIRNFIEDMYPTFEEGFTIDRINNNGNYEPSNCRWSAKNVQQRNTRILRIDNTSGYRGVSLIWNKKKWIAQITVDGKHKRVGYFDTALEAAIAYDTYVIEHNLEHTINGVI